MQYIVTSDKPVDEAARDLEAAVERHRFGVLHVHDLGNTLRGKGFDFAEQCLIYEICNPQRAKEVLEQDMDLNLVLPCRVSVYSREGQTCIGMVRPTALLDALSPSPALREIAEAVDEEITAMIDEAK